MPCERLQKIGRIGILGAVACGLAAYLTLAAVVVVTIRLPRSDGRMIGAVRSRTGGEIRLMYRHSVERTPVEGRFSVDRGPSLRIRETRMQSVGTGMPNTAPERTRRDGSWLVVDEGLKALPGLDFYLSPVNRTRITVDGSPVALDRAPAGSVLRLDVESISRGRWWLWLLWGKAWRKEG